VRVHGGSFWISAGVVVCYGTAHNRTRVAAPSVCFAVACILLAAAPTAPPYFHHWRRSSLLHCICKWLDEQFKAGKH